MNPKPINKSQLIFPLISAVGMIVVWFVGVLAGIMGLAYDSNLTDPTPFQSSLENIMTLLYIFNNSGGVWFISTTIVLALLNFKFKNRVIPQIIMGTVVAHITLVVLIWILGFASLPRS